MLAYGEGLEERGEYAEELVSGHLRGVFPKERQRLHKLQYNERTVLRLTSGLHSNHTLHITTSNITLSHMTIT